MKMTVQMIKYQMRNLARSRWPLIYCLSFMAITEGLWCFSESGSQTVVGLLSVVLMIVPLVSLIFALVYFYDTREFIKLLLCQPLSREKIFVAMYIAVTVMLAGSLILGIGLPAVAHRLWRSGGGEGLALLLVTGVLLTSVFVGLALAVASQIDDKSRGLAVVFMIWLSLAIIYDGLVMILIPVFSAYPIAKAVVMLSFLNPIDLARMALLMKLEISALLGYTGAMFRKLLDADKGIMLALILLGLWTVWPTFLGMRVFSRKDF